MAEASNNGAQSLGLKLSPGLKRLGPIAECAESPKEEPGRIRERARVGVGIGPGPGQARARVRAIERARGGHVKGLLRSVGLSGLFVVTLFASSTGHNLESSHWLLAGPIGATESQPTEATTTESCRHKSGNLLIEQQSLASSELRAETSEILPATSSSHTDQQHHHQRANNFNQRPNKIGPSETETAPDGGQPLGPKRERSQPEGGNRAARATSGQQLPVGGGLVVAPEPVPVPVPVVLGQRRASSPAPIFPFYTERGQRAEESSETTNNQTESDQLIELLAEFYAHTKLIQDQLLVKSLFGKQQHLAADELATEKEEATMRATEFGGADDESLLRWLKQKQEKYSSLKNATFELLHEYPNRTIIVCENGPKILVLPDKRDILYCYTSEQWIAKLWSDIENSLTLVHYPIIVLNFLIFLFGTTGNIFVCLSVYRNHQLRNVTNYFIVNLAFADLLVILICLPATVVWDLSLTWFFGTIPCKLIMFLQDVSISVSVLTLTAISIDRYYAICYPLKFKSVLSQAKRVIALIWIVSLALMAPDLIYLRAQASEELSEAGLQTILYSDCNYDWSLKCSRLFQFVKTILLYLVPFMLMFAAHFRILQALKVASASCRSATRLSGASNDGPVQLCSAGSLRLQNNGHPAEPPGTQPAGHHRHRQRADSLLALSSSFAPRQLEDTVAQVGPIGELASIRVPLGQLSSSVGREEKIGTAAAAESCSKESPASSRGQGSSNGQPAVGGPPTFARGPRLYAISGRGMSVRQEVRRVASQNHSAAAAVAGTGAGGAAAFADTELLQKLAQGRILRANGQLGAILSSSAGRFGEIRETSLMAAHDRSQKQDPQQAVKGARPTWSVSLMSAPVTANKQQHKMVVTMHNESKLESRRAAAKMLMTIVVLFGICYLPVHLINSLRQFIENIPQTDITSTISMLAHCICYLNSAINPIIYNHMNSVFRAEFKKFLSCFCWLPKLSRAQQSAALNQTADRRAGGGARPAAGSLTFNGAPSPTTLVGSDLASPIGLQQVAVALADESPQVNDSAQRPPHLADAQSGPSLVSGAKHPLLPTEAQSSVRQSSDRRHHQHHGQQQQQHCSESATPVVGASPGSLSPSAPACCSPVWPPGGAAGRATFTFEPAPATSVGLSPERADPPIGGRLKDSQNCEPPTTVAVAAAASAATVEKVDIPSGQVGIGNGPSSTPRV